MENKAYIPILVRYGGANKSVFEMDVRERQEASVSILRRAKEKAFSKRSPDLFWKEWPINGRIS
jgi:hypothetical protein